MGVNYRHAKDLLEEELKRLCSVRERILAMLGNADRRIQAVLTAREALAGAYEAKTLTFPVETIEESRPREFEVTASIRELLRKGSFTVPQIRDALVSQGWSTDGYKNPLAFVHQVLKRLIKVGDAAVEGGPGKKWYFDKRSREEEIANSRRVLAEQDAASRAAMAARSELKKAILDPCRKIVYDNPRGITSRAICRELQRQGFDLSNYTRPPSGIAQILREMGDVEVLRVERNGVVQNVFRIIQGQRG